MTAYCEGTEEKQTEELVSERFLIKQKTNLITNTFMSDPVHATSVSAEIRSKKNEMYIYPYFRISPFNKTFWHVKRRCNY